MEQEITKLLGKTFIKKYKVSIGNIQEEEKQITLLIAYKGTGSMFKLYKEDNITLKSQIDVIKRIIAEDIEWK